MKNRNCSIFNTLQSAPPTQLLINRVISDCDCRICFLNQGSYLHTLEFQIIISDVNIHQNENLQSKFFVTDQLEKEKFFEIDISDSY